MTVLHLYKERPLFQRLSRQILFVVGMFSALMNANISHALQPPCFQHTSSSYHSCSSNKIMVSCAASNSWQNNAGQSRAALRLFASSRSKTDHYLDEEDDEIAMLPNLDWPMSMDQPSSAIEESIQDGDRIRKFLELRNNRGKVVSSSSVKEPTTADPINNWAPSVPSSSESLPASKKTKKRKKQASRKSQKAPPKTMTLYSGCTIRRDLPYESTLEALKAFHQQEGHLVLPRKFLVPITDTCDNKKQEDPIAPQKNSYPEEWQGADLAGTVYDMKWWTRHIKHRPDRVADLNQLGYIWERIQPEWNLVLEALVTYGILHGDLLVPVKFVIPHDDTNYPRATWGIPLGTRVYRIRNRNDFLHGQTAVSRRNQLDSLGFVWDVREHQFNLFCEALALYAKHEVPDDSHRHNTNVRDLSNRQLKGALRIPAKYVVPKLPSWPKELWDYPLGAKCTAVRQKELYVKGQPDRLRILAELGFHDGGNDALSWLEVVHAAAVFSQMNNRKLDVPAKFVVPAPPKSSTETTDHMEEAWPWPDCLWGLPLGQRLRDIRLRGYYLRGESAQARRLQLDTLGFVWNPKRGRRTSASKAQTKQKIG